MEDLYWWAGIIGGSLLLFWLTHRNIKPK